jgi:class 3 adenylate cyclase
VQSILVALGSVILGLAVWGFFGMMQRYQLASASIAKLEHMKQYLGRFVPGTVQRLIEDNPEEPRLDKVEREATILFLDIDHYTQLAADLAPEALNQLIEKYFSVFLDIILSHSGEINETAGDSLMAIFTGKTPRAHALNAVRAAVAIREQGQVLNRMKASHDPEVFVNLSINTGQGLLGATMMKGTVGERFTYTASGMVTNIASRLCDLGNTGEIHLSDATAHMVQEDFALSGPQERHLKHIGGPVRIYTVVGSASSGGRCGRTREPL